MRATADMAVKLITLIKGNFYSGLSVETTLTQMLYPTLKLRAILYFGHNIDRRWLLVSGCLRCPPIVSDVNAPLMHCDLQY